MAVCINNQNQAIKGLVLEMDDRSGKELLLFNDGTNDAPDEGPTDFNIKNVVNTDAMTKGNPAANIEEYVHPEVFFCPLGSFNSKNNYNVDPRTTASLDDSWGEFAYLYGKILKADETLGRQNRIFSVNEESEQIVLVDVEAAYMKRADKFEGWSTKFEHYSGVFSDGSARHITNDFIELNYFLWDTATWAGS